MKERVIVIVKNVNHKEILLVRRKIKCERGEKYGRIKRRLQKRRKNKRDSL